MYPIICIIEKKLWGCPVFVMENASPSLEVQFARLLSSVIEICLTNELRTNKNSFEMWPTSHSKTKPSSPNLRVIFKFILKACLVMVTFFFFRKKSCFPILVSDLWHIWREWLNISFTFFYPLKISLNKHIHFVFLWNHHFLQCGRKKGWRGNS